MTGRDDRVAKPHATFSGGEGPRELPFGFPNALSHAHGTQRRWGASLEDWHHCSDTLGLTSDLLPVVSNQLAVTSPMSSLKGLGKTPSRYNTDRQVVGIRGWTEHVANAADVEAWSKEPDYGICIQTRRYRGLDIDIDDHGKALEVAFSVIRFFGLSAAKVSVRFRANSGRLLIPFNMKGALRKSIIKTPYGAIEFLADGQQFIAAGTHSSGYRYEWTALEDLLDLRRGLRQ